MSIIVSVRNFIVTYQALKEFSPVRVDFLDTETTAYTIDPVPSNTVISEDIAGNQLKQFVFVLQSREPWSSDVINNMNNIGWYEDFSTWLNTKTKANQLPTLGTNQTATSIRAADMGYLFQEGEGADKAIYQIQCILEYEEKGA